MEEQREMDRFGELNNQGDFKIRDENSAWSRYSDWVIETIVGALAGGVLGATETALLIGNGNYGIMMKTIYKMGGGLVGLVGGALVLGSATAVMSYRKNIRPYINNDRDNSR